MYDLNLRKIIIQKSFLIQSITLHLKAELGGVVNFDQSKISAKETKEKQLNIC